MRIGFGFAARSVLSLVVLCAVLTSCGDGVEEKKSSGLITDTEKHRMMQAEIDSLEQIVYADDFEFDKEQVVALRNTYDEFASRFSGDETKSPEYLYKSAALSRAVGKPTEAIKTYQHILTKFKGFERNPEVQFLIAFTYDEDIRERSLAKESYREVIEKFPGDHWAIQAERRLETIDMTDEEMIRYFMDKQGEVQ